MYSSLNANVILSCKKKAKRETNMAESRETASGDQEPSAKRRKKKRKVKVAAHAKEAIAEKMKILCAT